MTQKQKDILQRARENAPLMSFFSIVSLGISAAFFAGSFLKEFRDLKEGSLTPLEVQEVRKHMKESDDVEAYKALKEYNVATKAFNDKADTLANSVRKADSLARLNYTTIYQMKEGQSKFFADVLRELKRSQ